MIQPISSAPQSPAAIESVKAPVKVQEPEAGERPQAPSVDEYIPGEKREPSGRYWLEQGEDGQPRVCFDDPERAESCTGNTDRVDREIENLKKRQEELTRRLQSEADAAKVRALEQELSQVERELRQKDNDAYRRQHTLFS